MLTLTHEGTIAIEWEEVDTGLVEIVLLTPTPNELEAIRLAHS